ncbi:MAG: taurine dioxygenase [Rhodospirillaceae bacterium]|nr:taurine dioxygenase [Rhodospirillaceae bacterium]|tara:strand:- start:1090 stop:1956 length:867 start_codon:yes stop_codon:yes gene_type:complete
MRDIEIERLSGTVGAVVHGVDLTKPLVNSTFDAILEAWHDHSLLVFRDQNLEPNDHIAFARRFGEIEIHVLKANLMPEHPEILLSSNRKKPDGKRIGRAYNGEYWHSDGAYLPAPSKASLLYGIEIPVGYGDTMFASTNAAYEALSQPYKNLLDGLTCAHEFHQVYRTNKDRLAEFKVSAEESEYTNSPITIHPATHTHPETKRRALFVDPNFATGFPELEPGESDALLAFLRNHVTRPAFTYRHRWQPNDLLLWDNRSLVHAAIVDYDDTMPRYLHRVTVAGQPPQR